MSTGTHPFPADPSNSPGITKRHLTLAETIKVLLAVGVMGGLGYGGYLIYLELKLRNEIQTAWPFILEGARQQREAITKAIDAYKSNYGIYPPDHVISRNPLRVDPITNSLVYELGGTSFDPVQKTYLTAGAPNLVVEGLQMTFQTSGFTNAVVTPQTAKRFLSLDGFALFDLHDDPDVVSLQLPMFLDGVSPDAATEFEVSPWQYVTTGATHNPGRYDIWITLRAGDRHEVIGNWPGAK